MPQSLEYTAQLTESKIGSGKNSCEGSRTGGPYYDEQADSRHHSGFTHVCSSSAQITAAAAYIQRLKRNWHEKN